jgi:hypothetical protein
MRNGRCGPIAAAFALFTLEFANRPQAVLQLCQYSRNIATAFPA